VLDLEATAEIKWTKPIWWSLRSKTAIEG
jgi:hypothetical protein